MVLRLYNHVMNSIWVDFDWLQRKQNTLRSHHRIQTCALTIPPRHSLANSMNRAALFSSLPGSLGSYTMLHIYMRTSDTRLTAHLHAHIRHSVRCTSDTRLTAHLHAHIRHSAHCTFTCTHQTLGSLHIRHSAHCTFTCTHQTLGSLHIYMRAHQTLGSLHIYMHTLESMEWNSGMEYWN